MEGLKYLLLLCLLAPFISAAVVRKTEVEEIGNRYLDFRFRENPDYASLFGIKKYRNTSERWNYAAFNQRVEDSRAMLADVQVLLQGTLERSADKLTLQILRDNLQSVIDGSPFINFTAVLNEDIQSLSSKLTKFGVENLDDLNDWYYRCLSYIEMLKDQWTILTDPEYANLPALPKFTIDRYISRLNGQLVDDPVDFFAFQPWKDLTVLSTSSFYGEGLAMATEFNGMLRNITDYITTVYKPNRARDTIGLAALPGGVAMYQACLKFHTTPDYTAEKAHELGLSEVKRISAQMQEIASKDQPGKTVREYIEYLFAQPGETFNTSDEMVTGYEDFITNKIDPKIPKQFSYKPNIPLVVVADPGAGIGYYDEPSVDGTKPGTFKFNNRTPKDVLKVSMLSIAVHEANPGHHYQISYSIETGLPMFRRLVASTKYDQIPFHFPFYTAYGEGWGLYAESLSPELGIAETDRENFGRLGLESLRAARLVVDTGIHHYNWTYDKAVDYLFNYTTQSRSDCETQIQRYIRWPGQACAYKVGEIEIRGLRDQAEKELGDNFDIKEFHNMILSTGRGSIPLIKNEVVNWIEKQKALVSGGERATLNWSFGLLTVAALYFSYKR